MISKVFRYGFVAVALTILLSPFVRLNSASAQSPKLESCKPASERTGQEGCWIIASSRLGRLADKPIFWTLDVYATKASAEHDATPGSTVTEALGKVWLLTVGDKIKPAAQATRMAEIGPLPVKAGEDYTAQYRESIMQPGAVSRTHLHSGPEIFYTEEGQTCLETPAGKQVSSKGVNLVVAEGEPMELMATGSEMRRGIVLVLHSSDKPHTTLVTDWHSKGLCKESH
jgi:quercetin dioxygenase-like cupin family protein